MIHTRQLLIISALLIAGAIVVYVMRRPVMAPTSATSGTGPTEKVALTPLAIQAMRDRIYNGGDIHIESTLDPGVNYNRYIVSYSSDGLKIYALLTVPSDAAPSGGYPAIVFNHGYIPPEQYRTNERYVAYVDAFARRGYVVIKPDYRGHGESEGQPEGAYFSPAYTVDDLNALAAIKKYQGVNPDKIGLWGHSMGGNITLRDIVVRPGDIKVAVIWAGVVGSYDDIINHWHRRVPWQPSGREQAARANQRSRLVKMYGNPADKSAFWKSIDPTNYISDIRVPVQIHHGTEDEEVPIEFGKSLYDRLKSAGKTAEFYQYEGADHNISSPSYEIAMQRTVDFFDRYLK